MTAQLTICNNCKTEEKQIDGEFSYCNINWLILTRSESNSSTDSICAGTYHFCSEKCLSEFINKKGIKENNLNYDLTPELTKITLHNALLNACKNSKD